MKMECKILLRYTFYSKICRQGCCEPGATQQSSMEPPILHQQLEVCRLAATEGGQRYRFDIQLVHYTKTLKIQIEAKASQTTTDTHNHT